MMYRSLRSPGRRYREVGLRADGWSIDAVRILGTRSERYFGIGPRGDGPVMLLTRSIHTFNMKRPISVIVADSRGTVLRVGIMRPRRMIRFAAARWVVETEAAAKLPSPQMRIVASTIPRNARNVDPLRDTDRESRGSV
jgi:hypothetical protein